MLDSDLNGSAHMAYVARKVFWKIAALQRAGQKLNHAAKRQYYLSVIQSDLEYESNAFFSSLSVLAEKKLTGLYKRAIRAAAGLPPWSQVNSLELAKRFSLWPIIKRLKLKLLLLTFRCPLFIKYVFKQSVQYQIPFEQHALYYSWTDVSLSLSLYPKWTDDLVVYLLRSLALYSGILFPLSSEHVLCHFCSLDVCFFLYMKDPCN